MQRKEHSYLSLLWLAAVICYLGGIVAGISWIHETKQEINSFHTTLAEKYQTDQEVNVRTRESVKGLWADEPMGPYVYVGEVDFKMTQEQIDGVIVLDTGESARAIFDTMNKLNEEYYCSIGGVAILIIAALAFIVDSCHD